MCRFQNNMCIKVLCEGGLAESIGGWVGYFVGGMDGLLIALVVLMCLDYFSGVMCAIIDKKLSSAIGFRGICKRR